jgi:hypothetical protein
MLVYTAMKWRSVSSSALCVLAMLPFLALHHWLNYWTGGTFGPANANPQNFQYPGSPFSGGGITGVWIHRSAWNLIRYSIELWIGPHGFLLYNLPLLLVPLCAVSVCRIFPQKREEVLFAALLSAGSWIVYAVGSNNFSGLCCSIRFNPLVRAAFDTGLFRIDARDPRSTRSHWSIQSPHRMRNRSRCRTVLGGSVGVYRTTYFLADCVVILDRVWRITLASSVNRTCNNSMNLFVSQTEARFGWLPSPYRLADDRIYHVWTSSPRQHPRLH